MEENIIDKFKLTKLKKTYKNMYVVWLSWDSNDGDYIKDYRYIKEDILQNNPLLQYVLSYLCGGENYIKDPKDKMYKYAYGQYVDEDVNFSWLSGYLSDAELMLYSDWGPCHSLDEIEITYFNDNGVESSVVVPEFDKLFSGKKRKEMVEFMTDLYNKYKDDEGACSYIF